MDADIVRRANFAVKVWKNIWQVRSDLLETKK